MTTEIEKDIDLVAQHFLLDNEKEPIDVTLALATIGGSKQFETLGQAMYAAMLKIHMARLVADKTTLIAKEPRGNIH